MFKILYPEHIFVIRTELGQTIQNCGLSRILKSKHSNDNKVRVVGEEVWYSVAENVILVNKLERLIQFPDLLGTAGVSPDDGLADGWRLGPLDVVSVPLLENYVGNVRTIGAILGGGDLSFDESWNGVILFKIITQLKGSIWRWRYLGTPGPAASAAPASLSPRSLWSWSGRPWWGCSPGPSPSPPPCAPLPSSPGLSRPVSAPHRHLCPLPGVLHGRTFLTDWLAARCWPLSSPLAL